MMKFVHSIGQNTYWREFILYYRKLAFLILFDWCCWVITTWHFLCRTVFIFLMRSVQFQFTCLFINSFYPCQSKVAFHLSELTCQTIPRVMRICLGNSMICSDIWHKFNTPSDISKLLNLRQFWNITSGVYAKYHVQIMQLCVYTTFRKRFVIFTCRYFKLSWNTTALSQLNCRNFSCSSITLLIQTIQPDQSNPK